MCKKCDCNVCGNLVEEHDIRVVKHNHSDLRICIDCYENGYLWHGEEYYIIAVACQPDSTDEVFVQFHVSRDAAPEVLIHGIEVDIEFTQEALEKFACEHIAEYKWTMLENYFACI